MPKNKWPSKQDLVGLETGVQELNSLARKTEKKIEAQDKLLAQALEIQNEEAIEAGELAFFARVLILATMPHSKQDSMVFTRENGNFKLKMIADPEFGLPYGAMPRIILAWLCSEAIKTKMPVVELGNSMATFMHKLNLTPTGGERGTITYMKEHIQRLFSTTVSFSYNNEDTGHWVNGGFRLAYRTNLCWDPVDITTGSSLPSRVQLSAPFFDELLKHPIPLDMRALNVLRRSPLAIDIYAWLTYRFYRLQSPTVISWDALMLQFGTGCGNRRKFRQNFLKRLEKVKLVYPQANIKEVPRKGIKLWPSPSHVTPIH